VLPGSPDESELHVLDVRDRLVEEVRDVVVYRLDRDKPPRW